jgi:hypothetical protein
LGLSFQGKQWIPQFPQESIFFYFFVRCLSGRVKELMPKIVNLVAKGWTPIPDSELEVFLVVKKEVPVFAIRKNKKEVYVHVFCFEMGDKMESLEVVNNLYLKYRLGIPEFPKRPNWIHTIPLPGQKPSPSEITLIHEITQSLFWSVYMDFKRIVENRQKQKS